MIISNATFPIMGFMYHRVLLHIRCPFHCRPKQPGTRRSMLCLLGRSEISILLSVKKWGQKREGKLFTESESSEKSSISTPSSLLWLFLLEVDRVDAFALPLEVASWKWEIFGCKRMKHNMGAVGEHFMPGKSFQRRKFRLIELWVSSSSSFVLYFVRFRFETRFDSKSIIFLWFLNDTNGENVSFLYIHTRFFRHETREIPFAIDWCYD